MNKWTVRIPGEGDYPIFGYHGDDSARAREVYLKWAKRQRLPAGSKIWPKPWKNPPEKLRVLSECARKHVRAAIIYQKTDGSHSQRLVAPYSYKGQYDSEEGILFAEHEGRIKSFALNGIAEVRSTNELFEPKWEIDL